MDYKKYIDNIKDFQKEGIMFRDIQPLLANGKVFESAIDEMGNLIKERPKYWIGLESRGFLFASALAIRFGGGVRLIRKPGKLPNQTKSIIGYNLEYNSDIMEFGIYNDTMGEGTCVIVDDVYATGGTMETAVKLCETQGLQIIDKLCLIDIGIKKGHDVKCLIKY
jgi:adenine phosphoribosyltransferase